MITPERKARINIDHRLEQAGWAVQDPDAVNLYASPGVAVREFSLKPGHGTADYLLFVNQTAVGVVEAKREGSTLVGVEIQSDKYSTGLPDALPSYHKPLPFLFESTGTITQFTNLLDPDPRSRTVFGFHTPRTLAEWVGAPVLSGHSSVAEPAPGYAAGNLRQRIQTLPPLHTTGLWSVQELAVLNLEERSPRAGPGPLCRWLQAAARPSLPARRYTGSSNTPAPAGYCFSWTGPTLARRHCASSRAIPLPTTDASSPRSTPCSTCNPAPSIPRAGSASPPCNACIPC